MPENSALNRFIGVGLDILSTAISATTSTILAQLGDVISGQTDGDEAEWSQQVGFWSRPAAPTPNAPVNGCTSAQAITIKSGDRDVVISSRDIRTNSTYGNLKDGETCVGASVGQARTFYKANGAIVQYTTVGNAPGGTQVSQYIGPDKIQIMNQYGAITIDSTGITITAGQAALVLSASTGAAKLIGQSASLSGSAVAIAGTVMTSVGAAPGSMTLIGAAATPTTGAAYGPPGAGPVLLSSAGVFISPI